MKTKTKVLIVIGIVLLLVGFWFFGTRNSLVSLKEDVEMQQSQIETTLQRRNDLIPNLVATVKGYANHEEAVFTEIADARSKLAGSIESGDMESISEANTAGTENRIAVARQYYNEKLNTYNTKVQKFPSSIVAGMSGYYPMEYFEADEGAKEVPTVNFD